MPKTQYINNITQVHDQGNRGICYAVSTASQFRSFQNNVKKLQQVKEHQKVCEEIFKEQRKKNRDPDKGGDVLQTMKFLYKDENYDPSIVELSQASNAIKNDQSAIITFYLTQNQWGQFCQQFDKNPKKVYDLPEIRQEHRSQQISGHACVIVGQTNQYFVVKNSWGNNWGDKGFFRISKQSILKNKHCKLYHPKIIISSENSFKKQYLKVRNLKPTYTGGIKNIVKHGQYNYMEAKDKKNDHLISQQKDLVGKKHKNIHSIQSCMFDNIKQKHVLVNKHYDRNLQQRLNNKEQISGIQSAYIARDCLGGLQFLEKNNRNHGDINASNVVYDKNSKISKLNDFDLSKKFGTHEKTQFQMSKIQDSKKLSKMIEQIQQKNDKPEYKQVYNKITKNITENEGKHCKAKRKIEQQVILDSYKKQANYELRVCGATTLFNTATAVAKDVSHNGVSKNTIKTGARQFTKGAVGFGVKYCAQQYEKAKILDNVSNYNYRLSGKAQIGLMAATEVGKQIVDFAFRDKKINQDDLVKSSTKIALNVGEYAVCRQCNNTQYLVTKLAEKKVYGIVQEKIANYSANTISSTVGKSTVSVAQKAVLNQSKTNMFSETLKSSLKANAVAAVVNCGVGIAFDLCRGSSIKQAVTSNVKSSVGSYVGSAIGGAIGSVVPVIGTAAGSFIGGLLGGFIFSWF